jgi:hypothetical protein
MRTVDDLRRVFDEDALDAPGTDGIVDSVYVAAARIRRRRRVATAAAVIALVGIATAVPRLITGPRVDPPAPPAATAPGKRAMGQLTVSLAEGSNVKAYPGLDGTVQTMVLDTPRCCTEVRVYDPGTFSGTGLTTGTPVEVNGHQAWYAVLTMHSPGVSPRADDYTLRLPTVGWLDASGAWVTVYHFDQPGQQAPADVKTRLVEAADMVRIGPPKPVVVPFHFRSLPDRLRVTYADLRYLAEPRTTDPYLEIGLGGSGEPVTAITGWPQPSVVPPLQVTAKTLQQAKKNNDPLADPNLTVGGFPAWYFEGPQPPSEFPFLLAGQSLMNVKAGTCYVQVRVEDHTSITKSELTHMFDGATFDDCADSGTWKGTI